jgi:AcrR family transcriptional regulator
MPVLADPRDAGDGAERPTRPHGRRTRARILEAAVECLVELGYANTTTVAVQAKAGISRGRLLHHFPARDELLVAAVTHLGEARFGAMIEQVEANPYQGDVIDATVDAMWDSMKGPLFIAATELWVAARTHPELQAVLQPAEQQLWRHLRSGYQQIFGPYSSHPRFDEVLQLLVNGMRGFALTRNFDRSPRPEARHLQSWKRMAHELLAADKTRKKVRH